MKIIKIEDIRGKFRNRRKNHHHPEWNLLCERKNNKKQLQSHRIISLIIIIRALSYIFCITRIFNLTLKLKDTKKNLTRVSILKFEVFLIGTIRNWNHGLFLYCLDSLNLFLRGTTTFLIFRQNLTMTSKLMSPHGYLVKKRSNQRIVNIKKHHLERWIDYATRTNPQI